MKLKYLKRNRKSQKPGYVDYISTYFPKLKKLQGLHRGAKVTIIDKLHGDSTEIRNTVIIDELYYDGRIVSEYGIKSHINNIVKIFEDEKISVNS